MDRISLTQTWWAIALRGVAAVLFGALTFVVPVLTLAALVLLFGGYALADGVLNLVAAARGRDGGRPWWALVLEGIVSVAAGVVTFAWPGVTTLVLLYVIGAWAIVTGVLEIVASVRLRKHVKGEVWLALSGVLSVAFGVVMMIAPAAGALALVLWVGAYAIVFGVVLLALAFRLRTHRDETHEPMARAA